MCPAAAPGVAGRERRSPPAGRCARSAQEGHGLGEPAPGRRDPGARAAQVLPEGRAPPCCLEPALRFRQAVAPAAAAISPGGGPAQAGRSSASASSDLPAGRVATAAPAGRAGLDWPATGATPASVAAGAAAARSRPAAMLLPVRSDRAVAPVLAVRATPAVAPESAARGWRPPPWVRWRAPFHRAGRAPSPPSPRRRRCLAATA